MERLVGRVEPEQDHEAAARAFDARVEARLAPPPSPVESPESERVGAQAFTGAPARTGADDAGQHDQDRYSGEQSDGFDEELGHEAEEERPVYHAEAVQHDEPFPMEMRALPPARYEQESDYEASELESVEAVSAADSESGDREFAELLAGESSDHSEDLQVAAESVLTAEAETSGEPSSETALAIVGENDDPLAQVSNDFQAGASALDVESGEFSAAVQLESLDLAASNPPLGDELSALQAASSDVVASEVPPAAELPAPPVKPAQPTTKAHPLKPVKAWDPSRRGSKRPGRLVAKSSGPESLNQLVNGVNLRSGLVGPDGKKPTLVCFLPVQGGNGASTVSLHVAEAISHHLNERVLLADFDFHSGTLAFRLGLRPLHTLGDVFDWKQEKDHTWENAVCRWKKLDVLVAPPSTTSIHPQSLDRLPEIFVSAMRRYPYVIVDHPDAIYSSSRHIFTLADLVYLVCTPEITSLHLARRKVQQIRAMGVAGERLRLIVNRAGSWGSLGVQDIGKIVGVPVSWSLVNDYAALRDAVWNGGLVQEGSALAGQLRELGWSIMGVDAPVAAESAAPAEMSSQNG